MPRIPCPKCAKALSVEESMAGALARCPGCGHKFQIVLPASEAAPAMKPPPAPKPAPPAADAGYAVVAEEPAANFEVVEETRPKPAPDRDEEEAPRKKKKKKRKKDDVPLGQLLPWISNVHLGLIVASVGGLFLVSCCLLGGWWYLSKKEPAEDPEQAVAALKAKGAQVERDESQPDKPVIGVNMSGDGFKNGDLKHLRAFPQLRKVNLSHAVVDDFGLSNLQDLKTLQVLNLGFTKVSDGGMEYLGGLTSLEELDLSNTIVTDRGLEQLKGLTKLRKLSLEATLASGMGLKGALPNCEIHR